MSYLTLLNAAAQVVGGTQPDAAHAAATSGVVAPQLTYWYSGTDTGDSTGVAGLAGCFSLPTDNLPAGAVAIILPDAWSPLEAYPTQGHKKREDTIHVRVMVGHTDLQSAMAQLANFADLVPAAFDSHMTLLGQANVDTAWCSQGTFLEVEWPIATVYWALQFVVQVHRNIPVTYS